MYMAAPWETARFVHGPLRTRRGCTGRSGVQDPGTPRSGVDGTVGRRSCPRRGPGRGGGGRETPHRVGDRPPVTLPPPPIGPRPDRLPTPPAPVPWDVLRHTLSRARAGRALGDGARHVGGGPERDWAGVPVARPRSVSCLHGSRNQHSPGKRTCCTLRRGSGRRRPVA